jgi:dTDP-4-dehydrorhamnose reductase
VVIGNGLIAKQFQHFRNNNKILIFASGVSNSNETSRLEFEREFKLLQNTIRDYKSLKIIYFSTASIYDRSSINRPYVQHKIKMEQLISEKANSFLIFRVSNLVGKSKNKTTIINFFMNSINNGYSITVWKNAERNIIDISDAYQLILGDINGEKKNKIINIAHRNSVNVYEIVKLIEEFLNKNAKVRLVDKGNKINIDVSEKEKELIKIEKEKGSGLDYIKYLLHKYYEPQLLF